MLPSPGRDGHDRERRLITALGCEYRTIRDEDVVSVVNFAVAVDHALFGLITHAGRSTLVNVFSENA